MTFLVCVVPVCPVRAEAAHRSEQTSQLLFGEKCELLEELSDFVRIRVLHDDYEGWCQTSQLTGLNENECFFENKNMAGEWINKIMINEKPMSIPFGSCLGFLNDGNGFLGKAKVTYAGILMEPIAIMDEKSLEKITSFFLNTSYMWGGRSVFGIDCSGFTQLVFKCFGIPLLRDACQQATQGKVVNFLENTKCGDLVFFNNESGKITHTGILINSNTIVHASGKVRVDTIDDDRIINSDTGKQTHHLQLIKRIENKQK